MNHDIEVPPVISPRNAITYTLTRWDLVANWMLILFRNRILQVFVLLAWAFNGWLQLADGGMSRSLGMTVFYGLLYSVSFFGFCALVQALLGLAHAFLVNQHGIVGQHTLEITAQGLIERTEFNETLHRWSSICRLVSVGGYLFIYVGGTNSHQVPTRYFSSEDIDRFKADLRRHAEKLHS